MNFFDRAIKNVIRRPSKSILLALTFFIIGNLVIIGLGISTASENAKILTRKQMRAIVSYEIDYDAFWQYADSIENEEERNDLYQNNYPTLDPDFSNKLMSDKRVKAANFFSDWVQFYGRDIEYVPNPYADENNNYGEVVYEDGTSMAWVPPGFKIQANNYPNQIELAEGTYNIIEGRYYTQDDLDDKNQVCLISDELAQYNNLKVGDSITISQMDKNELSRYLDGTDMAIEDFDLSLEIIGIYDNTKELDPNDSDTKYMQPYELPANIILMPATTYYDYSYNVNKTSYEYYKNLYPESYVDYEYPDYDEYVNSQSGGSAVFLLNDPLDVEDFVDDYKAELKDFTKLNANNEQFNKLARPLDTLSFFSNIIVVIVVFNAIVIITLVTALTLKTRSYEIGVLLSMGVTKAKVVMQLFIELIIVALLGFTLSVISGSMIAGKVGDMVLDYQKETEEQYNTEDNNNYYYYDTTYFTEITQDDMLSQYEVKISPLIIAEIYVLGLGVVFISILIPSVMIMRFNPKQILLNTN